MTAYFVTGTDTGVGKTTVTVALLAAAAARGLRTLALKPVAAGAVPTPQGLRNEDALALRAAMTVPLAYEEVNPVLLPAPLSPHLAARQAGRRVSVAQLAGFCRGALQHRADLALVEGAGGWRVPLNEHELLSGLPHTLTLPVILVVGLRLGCLNHALLTAEAIARDGLRLAAWVGNTVDPHMTARDDNVATLQRLLPAPCLGVLPWQEAATPAVHAARLDLGPLLG